MITLNPTMADKTILKIADDAELWFESDESLDLNDTELLLELPLANAMPERQIAVNIFKGTTPNDSYDAVENDLHFPHDLEYAVSDVASTSHVSRTHNLEYEQPEVIDNTCSLYCDNDQYVDNIKTEYQRLQIQNDAPKAALSLPYSTNSNRPLVCVDGKGKRSVRSETNHKSSRWKTTSTVPVSAGPQQWNMHTSKSDNFERNWTMSDNELSLSNFSRPVCYGDQRIGVEPPQVVLRADAVVSPFLMSCEACDAEKGHNSLVECCNGHLVCAQCVEKSTKAVLVGERKGPVICSVSGCDSSVPQSELRKSLPSLVLDLLEEKWNKDAMEALENMKDIRKCPWCRYPAVIDLNSRRFDCINCNKVYCVHCEYEWHSQNTHEMCMKTKNWTSPETGNLLKVPEFWTDISNTVKYTRVTLDKNSAEFQDICKLVLQKPPTINTHVVNIYRIQNTRLWEKYSLNKSHMTADLGDSAINERRLFHGTQIDVVDAICKEGFDWRLCGKHGTAFGHGTYFAQYASTSHTYAAKDKVSFGFTAMSGFGPYTPPGMGMFSKHGTTLYFYSPMSTPQYKPPLQFGNHASTCQARTSNIGFFTAPGSTNQSHVFKFGNINNPPPPSGQFHFGNSSKQGTELSSSTFGVPGVSNSMPNSGNANSGNATVPPQSSAFSYFPASQNNIGQSNTVSSTQNTVNFKSHFDQFTGTQSNLAPQNLNWIGNDNKRKLTVPLTPSKRHRSGSDDNQCMLSEEIIYSDFNDLTNSKDFFMIIARVLVGRTCAGHAGLRRPQPDALGRATHSAVDSEDSPMIFVIFDNAQCYPEYVVQYNNAQHLIQFSECPASDTI